MIKKEGKVWILGTINTNYIFRVLESGQLEHLYYGKKLVLCSELVEALSTKVEFLSGCGTAYSLEYPNLCLEQVLLEMSSYGKGDKREPFVEITYADGSTTSDFIFERADEGEIESLTNLPCAYDELSEARQLTVTLKEKVTNVRLQLIYQVFEDCDVIVRNARIINGEAENIMVNRLMSGQLDFADNGYRFTTFTGAWAREMNKQEQIVESGLVVNQSVTGNSSNYANPFVMISGEDTTEDYGNCIGCNLIYSGNHYEAIEVDSYLRTRFVSGINPKTISWTLESGRSFDSPQAVFCYSDQGFQGMSNHMHAFVRNHIVRGEWKERQRPVLLNSWESAYFDFDENRLCKLVKAAKETGMELFVLDDGWFGNRNDDTTSLGDWMVNKEKLPGGLESLSNKIHALGMGFGIWVEPEMISVDSDLYRKHPDYVVEIPGRDHSEGRHQRILDLTKKEVSDYVIKAMEAVFEDCTINYVKWDMNRNFSDIYSKGLEAGRQGEFSHRYILGLYRIMDRLTKRFPEILFEGCASGGNRFDLGILCYMPQIWASDNTDAICRTKIQNGYSYGYPQSTYSAHVSACPNHQTLRNTPLESRFQVAMFGVLGYECNLLDCKKEELEAITEQVLFYKKHRKTLQFGEFYRLKSKIEDGEYKWLCVSYDKKKAIGMMSRKEAVPNLPYASFQTKGLAESTIYHIKNREITHNVKSFGSLINTITPVHIRQDSLAHNLVSRFVKMDGEMEEYTVSGSLLNHAGVKLLSNFCGNGYNENTRLYEDYASRAFVLEERDEG